jgi:hypothetical protein
MSVYSRMTSLLLRKMDDVRNSAGISSFWVFAKLVPTGAIDKFVDTIEAELYKVGQSEVSSSYIGDLVMTGLKKLDHIAYIRFASVYRKFADIGALKQEVDSLAARGELTPANQLPLPSSEAVSPLTGRKGR